MSKTFKIIERSEQNLSSLSLIYLISIHSQNPSSLHIFSFAENQLMKERNRLDVEYARYLLQEFRLLLILPLPK